MIADKLAQRLRGAFNIGLARPDDPYRFLQYLPVPLMPAGVHITMENAREIAVVWACMDAITKAIVCCPWNVFTWAGPKKRQHLPDDNLDYLLNTRPNPDMPAISAKECLMYMALSFGNAYAEIVPDGANRVAQLYPLLSDRVTPHRRTDTWEIEYHYQQPGYDTLVLPADRIFHLRGPSVTGLMGDNMTAKMAKSLALMMALERFASTYFGNNTIIGGVLEYPKTLDDRTYERMKSSFEDKFKGPDKAHSFALLEGGMKFVPFGTTGKDSMMVEARKFQTEEICRFFGVPLHKVQHIDRATFNNIEHLGIEFVRDAITPWALRLEQEANYKLLQLRGRASRGKFTKLDTSWLSWGDYKTRMEGHNIGRNMGLYSANDILEMEGRNTIGPEGDVRIIPVNMQTMRQALLNEEKSEEELEQLKSGDLEDKNEKRPSEEEIGGAETASESEIGSDDTKRAKTHALICDAVSALLASALERYQRRLKAREADLIKSGLKNGKVAANLTQERERLRETMLLQEAVGAVTLIDKYTKTKHEHPEVLICEAADLIDAGEEPRQVASKMVLRLVPVPQRAVPALPPAVPQQ